MIETRAFGCDKIKYVNEMKYINEKQQDLRGNKWTALYYRPTCNLETALRVLNKQPS